MKPLYELRKNVKRKKYIQMIHAHAEVERNTNSAVEDLQNKNKMCRAFGFTRV